MTLRKLIALLLIPVLQGASMYWVFAEHYCLDEMACGVEETKSKIKVDSCCAPPAMQNAAEQKDECCQGESVNLAFLSNNFDHHFDSECCKDEFRVYQPVIHDVLVEDLDFSLVLAPNLLLPNSHFVFSKPFPHKEEILFNEAQPTLVGNSQRQALLGVFLC